MKRDVSSNPKNTWLQNTVRPIVASSTFSWEMIWCVVTLQTTNWSTHTSFKRFSGVWPILFRFSICMLIQILLVFYKHKCQHTCTHTNTQVGGHIHCACALYMRGEGDTRIYFQRMPGCGSSYSAWWVVYSLGPRTSDVVDPCVVSFLNPTFVKLRHAFNWDGLLLIGSFHRPGMSICYCVAWTWIFVEYHPCTLWRNSWFLNHHQHWLVVKNPEFKP